MTLLRMKDSTSTGKSLICELCDSGDSGVSRCTNCSVFMCMFCVTAHKRINTFKGHKILSLEEVKSVGSQALIEPSFCEKHSGEALKLFCQTCQKTICRDCTIVDHREHKYDFIADVAEREKNAVQAVLQRTKDKHSVVAEGFQAVQTMKSCVQRKVTEVTKQVDCFFDEQVKALEYYRANLKHEATMQGEQKVKQLESQAEMLSLLLAQLKSSIEFADRAMADGDDVKLLSLKKELIQRLSQLNSSQNQLKPCKDDYIKLQVHQLIWDIGKMASLCYIPADPQKCTVCFVGGEEGVMYQTFTGQSVDFLLIIKDKTDNKVTAGGNHVQAQVSFNSEASQARQEKLAVQDNSDGSYSFSYCPRDEGLATLTVLVDGQSVRGSPFNWQVNSVRESPFNPYQQVNSELDLKRKSGGSVSKKYLQVLAVKQSHSAFTEGMHSWKLQLVSYSPGQKRNGQEIIIGVSDNDDSFDWCWCFNSANQNSSRSDGKPSSITSVQNKDIFTVFLNLKRRRLIVYSTRSKEAELFTGVKGKQLSPLILPSTEDSLRPGDMYLTLDVQKIV